MLYWPLRSPLRASILFPAISELAGRINVVQPAPRDSLDRLKAPPGAALEEALRFGVAKGANHLFIVYLYAINVNCRHTHCQGKVEMSPFAGACEKCMLNCDCR
jgi:hypothetical protein